MIYSELLDEVGYDKVASEYYDERLHPTCADLREASLVAIKRYLSSHRVSGKIADVGCGKSILVELRGLLSPSTSIVLIDQSVEMAKSNGAVDFRQVNVLRASFGSNEFDKIFVSLGDPFNALPAWKNIALAMKDNGECVFVIPSFVWANKFRSAAALEREGYACFLLKDGSSAYLQSLIFNQVDQTRLINSAGLVVEDVDQVTVAQLSRVRSPKISAVLSPNDPVVDVYRVRKKS